MSEYQYNQGQPVPNGNHQNWRGGGGGGYGGGGAYQPQQGGGYHQHQQQQQYGQQPVYHPTQQQQQQQPQTPPHRSHMDERVRVHGGRGGGGGGGGHHSNTHSPGHHNGGGGGGYDRGGRGGGRGGGGRGYGRGHGGGGGGYHHPPPSAGTISDENGEVIPSLQVLDMGLDFKSYSFLVNGSGQSILGNVFNFSADEVAEAFEPTVGLFVTLLHLGMASQLIKVRKAWLTTYQVLQRVFASSMDSAHESHRFAEDAVNLISNAPEDDKIFEDLFQLLDMQSEMSGVQAPSQRRVQRDPRGTFCNLHLATDKKCNQDFACNQLHLLKTGSDTVKHRMTFYSNLVDELSGPKVNASDADIAHRLRDCIFFAKYGNRVTVRLGGHGPHGGWVHFFKTAYTQGRLSLALRQSQGSCNSQGGPCRHGPNCLGVHLQDRQPQYHNKQVDLHQSDEAMNNIEIEVQRVLGVVAHRRQHAASAGTSPALAGTSPTAGGGRISPPPIQAPTALGNTPNSEGDSNGLLPPPVESPTTRSWANAVQEYKHSAEKEHPEHHDGTKGRVDSTDQSLLLSLQRSPASGGPVRTPTTPDGSTPLLAEIQQQRFDEVARGTRQK